MPIDNSYATVRRVYILYFLNNFLTFNTYIIYLFPKQILTFLFVAIMYTSGIPILYLQAAFALFVLYWVDKYLGKYLINYREFIFKIKKI